MTVEHIISPDASACSGHRVSTSPEARSDYPVNTLQFEHVHAQFAEDTDMFSPRTLQQLASKEQEKPAENAPVHFKMTLGLDFRIAGSEGSDEQEKFKLNVVQDLASASYLPSANFRIKEVSSGLTRGYTPIMVNVEVMPDPLSPGKHLLAVNDLANQAVDASSKLRSGKITSHAIEVEITSHTIVVEMLLADSPADSPAPHLQRGPQPEGAEDTPIGDGWYCHTVTNDDIEKNPSWDRLAIGKTYYYNIDEEKPSWVEPQRRTYLQIHLQHIEQGKQLWVDPRALDIPANSPATLAKPPEQVCLHTYVGSKCIHTPAPAWGLVGRGLVSSSMEV